MNISSVIVFARPGQAASVCAELERLAGVEVQAVSPEGKIIVTIETADELANVAAFERIGQIAGVMSTAMAYHQAESEPDQEL